MFHCAARQAGESNRVPPLASRLGVNLVPHQRQFRGLMAFLTCVSIYS